MATELVGSSSESRLTTKLRAMKSGSISSVRMLVKLFELQMMSEGRKTKVVLLDGQKFDLLVQPKLFAGELLDLAASHFSLKEKEYFGLRFIDSFGQSHWLQLDRRVLDHSFLKSTGPLVLYLAVRFFVESISFLKDNATVELFYLQSRQAIHEGKMNCDSDNIFILAAFALEATIGNFVNEETARAHLKNLSVFPTETLKEFPSISYCEDRVLTIYRNVKGHSKGSSIISYMSIVERLPMYGIHYYEVKDRSGLPWWLGISYKGISLYDFDDKKVPRRIFPWNQLENLYFRDRKFSVEVHNAKRASVTRRTFFSSNINVHSWTTESGQLTKNIWSMAIAQHQFYLDCKNSKLALARTMRKTSTDFTHENSEGARQSRKIKRGHRTCSRSASVTDAKYIPLLSGKLAERELFDALKDRKKALEKELQEKLKSFREVCLSEVAITGHLRDDVPGDLNDPEVTLPAEAVLKSSGSEDRDLIEDVLEKLEEEFRMQKRITCAYWNLVNSVVDQQVYKSRQLLYCKALKKLKETEKKLKYYCQLAGKPLLQNELQVCTSSERTHKMQVPAACSSPDLRNATVSDFDAGQVQCHWFKSKISGLPNVQSHSQGFFATSSKLNRHGVVGRAAASGSAYPLLSAGHPMDLGSNNDMALYSLTTHETTNYDTSGGLSLLLSPSNCSDLCSNRWPSKHASLEGAYKKGTRASGGAGAVRLDRNLSSGCLECHDLFADSVLPLDPSFGSFPDLGGEEEPNVHTFQSQPEVELRDRCCKTLLSSALSENSRENFGGCSIATVECSNRCSCYMKEQCSCCAYAQREHCVCHSYATVKQCSCLRENCSHLQTSSQTPKTTRRRISPSNNRRQRHTSRDADSGFQNDQVIALNSVKTCNYQIFTNTSQSAETSFLCSCHHRSRNSGADAAVRRSCSVSRSRTSKRNSSSAAGSSFSKHVPSSDRDVTGSRGAKPSHHVRSHSVHAGTDFGCTSHPLHTSFNVGP